MIEKIFGEKKSIQRNLIIQFTIATISIVIVTLIGFYLLVNNQALEKLIQINVNTKEEIKELLSIIRRSVGSNNKNISRKNVKTNNKIK